MTNSLVLFAVVASDHLYEGRVGSLVWEDKTRVYLDLGGDKCMFNREEVQVLYN